MIFQVPVETVYKILAVTALGVFGWLLRQLYSIITAFVGVVNGHTFQITALEYYKQDALVKAAKRDEVLDLLEARLATNSADTLAIKIALLGLDGTSGLVAYVKALKDELRKY